MAIAQEAPPRLAVFQNRRLLTLMLGHFTIDCYAGLLPVLYPLLVHRFSLDLATVGLVSLAYSGMSSLVQPLFGWLADRSGTRYIGLALMWTAGSFAVLGFAPSFPVLLLLAALAGVGSGAYHPFGALNASAVIREHERNTAMSIYVTGGTLGVALGPLIGILLFNASGLATRGTIFMLVPGACIALWLLVELGGRAPHPLPPPLRRGEGSEAENGAGLGDGAGPNPLSPFPRREGGTRALGGAEFGGHEPMPSSPRPGGEGQGEGVPVIPARSSAVDPSPLRGGGGRGWGETPPRRLVAMIVVVGIMMSRSWMTSSLQAYVPTWYASLGYPPSFYGPLATTLILASAVGAIGCGSLADRFGRRGVILASLVLSVPALLAVAQFTGPVAFLTLTVVGLSASSSGPLLLVMAQQLMQRRAGVASGLILGLGFITGAIGIPITGLIADASSMETAIRAQVVLVAATILLAWYLPSEARMREFAERP